MRRLRALACSVVATLALSLVGWGPPGGAPAHALPPTCTADPPGGHDPRAELKFTGVLTDRGRTQVGRHFEYGKISDLIIEVRWQRLRASARQRLELYSPNGHVYQMFTRALPAEPAPVEIRVPVVGSWIMSATLAGTWCAKVFLDDDPDPVAADSFELRFSRR